MKREPAPRTHTADDPPPTVIHHPEEDDTLLAKWLKRGMDKGASFWLMAAGVAGVAVLVGYLINGLATRESPDASAWRDVMLGSSPEDFQKVADEAGDTAAGQWAALKAASSHYRDGLSRLPADREAGRPLLQQALDEYRKVDENAKGDPLLKRLAMLGQARALEARDELSEAVEQYERVAKEFPSTDDGKAAAERAKLLKTPDAIAFYKKFAAYTPGPASTILPPRGTNRLDLPAGHPPLDGPLLPAPALPGVPAGSVESPAADLLPPDVFQKPAGAPKRDETIPDVFPDEPTDAKAKPKDAATPK